jgi:hypothetical protein
MANVWRKAGSQEREQRQGNTKPGSQRTVSISSNHINFLKAHLYRVK